MNKVYRLIWSASRQAWCVAAEIARSGGKKSSRAIVQTVAGVLVATSAQAQLPTGGQVIAGSGTIATQGNSMTISQHTHRMAADWQSFSIGQGNMVNFVQPSASSVALNRVVGSDVSVIQGALKANGQLFLVNPNGVLFTPTSQVNVGGIVASTLDISTQDFMAGNYEFTGNSTNAVMNQGNITAASGGYVAMIAARIENHGTINAQAGNVLMGAGRQVTLDLGGPVKIQVNEGALNALIEQGGAIKADGGLVYLTAKAADNLLSTVINHTGITEAQTLASGESGRIYLMGDMEQGSINVAGTLDASAPDGGDGGFIETSAAKVSIQPDLLVTTKAAGGQTGEWLIDPNDYTVAASGGDITGSQLSANLANTSITIQSIDGANAAGNGDIFVNDAITWSSGNILLLRAQRNIEINAAIDATQGSGGILGLAYGLSAPAAGNTATYTINAPVNLQSGVNFATAFGSDGPDTYYTVVNTQAELQAISNNLSGNYALGSTLRLSGEWTAIGTESSGFTGRFDGLGNTLHGLTINVSETTNYQGLFGYSNGAAISNIRLLDVNISGGRFIGSLVGWAIATDIHNASADDVLLTGERGIGGLVGYMTNGSTIVGSSARGETRGNGAADIAFHGGLVGIVETGGGGNIKRSYAHVDVASNTGARITGGLVGLFRGDGVIEDSYASGKVSGTATSTNNGTGGLVGRLGDSGDTNASILRSYATGEVVVLAATQTSYAGGLIGRRVDGTSVSHSLWDIDTTGQNNAVGIGVSTGILDIYSFSDGNVAAYSQADYELQGFDFTNTWWMVDGSTRPFLRSEWSSSVANAHELQLMAMKPSASYTLINDIDLAPSLTNQSDMWKGTLDGSSFQGSWSAVGKAGSNFIGSFDGNDKTISNLTINTTSNAQGLFGIVGNNATISNLTLSDVNISAGSLVGGLAGSVTGANTLIENISVSGTIVSDNMTNSATQAGGLAGYNAGTIRNSASSVSVTGSTQVGGLVGFNGYASAKIETSYATGTVTANGADSSFPVAGGLVGENTLGSITNSYATGNVVITSNQNDTAGGLVGKTALGTISNSYATGSVSATTKGGLIGSNDSGNATTVNNSFYDKTLNAGLMDESIYGKTTAELRSLATYAEGVDGWDISGIGGDGTIWRIYDGYTMPLLRSFLTPLTLSVEGDLSRAYDATTVFDASGLTLSWIHDGNVITPDASLFFLSGGVPEFVLAGKNAGSQALLSQRYSIQTGYDIIADIHAEITKADLAVTGLTADNKVYDATVAATLSGAAVVTALGADSVSLTGTAIGEFADKNAGDDKSVQVTGLTLSGTDAGNYNLIQPVGLTADITPRPVTVTADNQTKAEGAADPDLTFSTGCGALPANCGVVVGESLLGSLDRVAGETSGNYAIEQGTLTDDLNPNYMIEFVGADLTITAVNNGNDNGGNDNGGGGNGNPSIPGNSGTTNPVNNAITQAQQQVAQAAVSNTSGLPIFSGMNGASGPASMAAVPANSGNLQLSGGMVFVPAEDDAAVSAPSGQPGISQQAGLDASGFMRVFVTRGGINVPAEADYSGNNI